MRRGGQESERKDAREVRWETLDKRVDLVVESQDVRVVARLEQLLEVVRDLSDDARERVSEDAVGHGRRLTQRSRVGSDSRDEVGVLEVGRRAGDDQNTEIGQ